MQENSNKIVDETQYNEQQIVAKLREAALDGKPNDFTRTIIGDDLFEFYFGDNGKDINKLLADSYSEQKWETLLEKHKAGKITTEELVDVIKISHVHADERANPVSTAEEVVDRAFEGKLKGRIGQKIITSTINALSEQNLLNAPKEAVQAFISYQSAVTDTRAEPKEDQKFLPSEITHKVHEAAKDAYSKFQDSLNVSDLIRDITSEELIGRLNDENDPYFGITHQIIFDIGWEKKSREDDSVEKFLSIYVCELDKAWTDSISSNLKESDRRVSRYIVSDVKAGDLETVNKIRDKIIQVYCNRFQEKIEFFIKKVWA